MAAPASSPTNSSEQPRPTACESMDRKAAAAPLLLGFLDRMDASLVTTCLPCFSIARFTTQSRMSFALVFLTVFVLHIGGISCFIMASRVPDTALTTDGKQADLSTVVGFAWGTYLIGPWSTLTLDLVIWYLWSLHDGLNLGYPEDDYHAGKTSVTLLVVHFAIQVVLTIVTFVLIVRLQASESASNSAACFCCCCPNCALGELITAKRKVPVETHDELPAYEAKSSVSTSSTASTASSGKPSGGSGHTRLLRGGAPLAVSKMTEKSPLLSPVKAAAVVAETEQPPLASDAKTFMSAIIAFLGSGVLGFPYAFKQTGITLGVAILLVVGSLTAFCMLLIVECKYQILKQRGVAVSTYGEIGAMVMGRTGQWLVNLSLVISQAGFTVGYLIFISANVNAYFGLSKQVVVMLCVPPLVLFCLIRHLKQLSYVALVADVMNFSGLAVVFAADFSYMDFSATSPQLATLNVVGTLSSIPFFFGVATYSFAGIGMALPLENSMENKTHFRRILLQTVALIAMLYATFGICGYLAFGAETKDVVTLNIDGRGSLSTIVKLCICVGLLCACPLMLFPVFEALQPACLSPLRLNERSVRTEQAVIIMFRSLVVVLVATIAGAAPNFGVFISFIGSTCCSCLGFVLPVVFHLQLFKDSHSTLSKWALRGITLIGLFAVAAGFYTAGSSMF